MAVMGGGSNAEAVASEFRSASLTESSPREGDAACEVCGGLSIMSEVGLCLWCAEQVAAAVADL